jgi:hypothetical protein
VALALRGDRAQTPLVFAAMFDRVEVIHRRPRRGTAAGSSGEASRRQREADILAGRARPAG